MPWKKDENGVFAVDDAGNPVWTDEAGQDKGVDYVSLSKRLSETTKESVQRKEKLRELEKTLEPFSGIENPMEWVSEAQKALDMMRNAPDKEKALEDQIRARVEAATKPLHEKISVSTQSLASMSARLEQESIGNAINNIPLWSEFQTPLTVKGLFRERVAMDEDGVYVKDENGQPLYGESGRMTPAEGLMAFTNSHPEGRGWLKGARGTGTGANPHGGGGNGSAKPLAECKTESEKIAWLKSKAAQG